MAAEHRREHIDHRGYNRLMSTLAKIGLVDHDRKHKSLQQYMASVFVLDAHGMTRQTICISDVGIVAVIAAVIEAHRADRRVRVLAQDWSPISQIALCVPADWRPTPKEIQVDGVVTPVTPLAWTVQDLVDAVRRTDHGR